MSEDDDVQSRPVWDEKLANESIDKIVLVGLTFYNSDQSVDRHEQFFGGVRYVDKRDGVLLNLEGSHTGHQYNLPPDLRSFFKASPGEYRLRSTNEAGVSKPANFFTACGIFKQRPASVRQPSCFRMAA